MNNLKFRLLLIFTITLILFAGTACNPVPTNPSLPPDPIRVSTYADVIPESKIILFELNTTEKPVESGKIIFTLTNRSNDEYMYGNPYWLEVKLDSKWYTIPFLSRFQGFTANWLTIEAGETITRTLMIEDYPALTNGEYRIITSISQKDPPRETIDIAVSFTITNSDVTDNGYWAVNTKIHTTATFREIDRDQAAAIAKLQFEDYLLKRPEMKVKDPIITATKKKY